MNSQSAQVISAMRSAVSNAKTIKRGGAVVQIVGLMIEATGPQAPVGDVCLIRSAEDSTKEIFAEVVGFRNNRTLLMPIGDMTGISPGDSVIATNSTLEVPIGNELLGRTLNAVGAPIDDGPSLRHLPRASVFQEPPDPVRRPRIKEVLPLGIRSIDGILTIGCGQRIGIFSGSGVGKSTVLGMMARYTEADVAVVALVGERGREVRDFIEKDLGVEGLKKSVLVVATSDQPPLMRIRAADRKSVV